MSSRKGKVAGFVEPMLCLPVVALPEGDEWLYEIKLPGAQVMEFKELTLTRE